MNRALQDLAEFQKVAVGPRYDAWVFNRGYSRAGDSYERQVAKLYSSIYKKGWLDYLKELGIPAEHPTWIAAALKVELPDLPEAYSPLILSGFNEEKYIN